MKQNLSTKLKSKQIGPGQDLNGRYLNGQVGGGNGITWEGFVKTVRHLPAYSHYTQVAGIFSSLKIVRNSLDYLTGGLKHVFIHLDKSFTVVS